MKKEDLLSMLSKIEPDNELKEKTKLKMMNIAMVRKDEKQKRPNFFAKMSTTICAAALVLVCISAFGVQKFMPHSYVAEISENSHISIIAEDSVPSRIAEAEPNAFTTRTREADFESFLSGITEEYRAIGVEGTLVSKEIFVCEDENEYGIYGFVILNIKISDVFFSENEPFFGIKKGDTVSFVKYLYSDSEMNSLAKEGYSVNLFAYSDKNMIPLDDTAKKIGLENVFVIFE